MHLLHTIDWTIIIGYICLSIGIALYLSRRGRSSSEEYFKSGGGTPWWLLGTSMVATTFAADTPLALAGFVVTTGISKNWFWWCQVPITMAGVFFFARLWKRANPLTDMEFVYVRYSGKAASVLRGFKAFWIAVPITCLILGWVNKAMTKIIVLCVPDFPRIPIVDGIMLSIFMATPLSQDVDSGVKEAYRQGQLQPLQIARSYELMKYENFQLFQEIQNGVYDEHAEMAFQRLNLPSEIQEDSLINIQGLPAALYQEGGKAPATVAEQPQAATAGMLRPVRLADGVFVEYDQMLAENQLALSAGQENLGRAKALSETQAGPLAEMKPLEFFRNIYEISAGVLTYKVLFLLFLITVAYTAISGLWGVLVTDFVQFWIAMAGCIYLAFVAVSACGGMEGLLTRMSGIYTLEKARAMIGVIPTAQATELGLMPLSELLIFVMFVWWCVGMSTDGGSIFAQRMLSAKDERNAALGYLWYGIAHYALRMWPWLIVGFAAAVLFPYVPYPNGNLPGKDIAENGYIHVMLNLLKPGFLGVLLASFLAAYMSTISSQVNIAASYLMNDLYRPFIANTLARRFKFELTEKHFVRVGILMTFVVAICGIVVSLMLNTIAGAWFLLAAFTSGIGVIYLLRWYWWRINAWTELTCLISLFYIAMVFWWMEGKFEGFPGMPFPYNVLIAAPFSVGLALLVTLYTAPTDREKLKEFCRKVQPGGPGWRVIEEEIRKEDPGFVQRSPLHWKNFRNWLLGIATIYCFLFGIGKVVTGDTLYPVITYGNALMGMFAFSTIVTWLFSRVVGGLRFSRFVSIDLGLILVMIVLRAVFGDLPEEFFLNALFLNRTIGILLLVLGAVCGYLVAQSFSTKQWSEE